MDLNLVFSQYQFDDHSSPNEIIEFTVRSLQAVLTLPNFKYITKLHIVS